MREGDSGIGIPIHRSEEVRFLPQSETEEYEQKQETTRRKIEEESFDKMLAEDGWRLPAPVRKAITLLFLTVTAVLGVYIVNQTVTFLKELSELPQWGQIVATVCMGLFGIIIAYVFYQLFSGLYRLQKSPSINNRALNKLKERKRLQHLAIRHEEAARKELSDYLMQYPVDSKTQREFNTLGMTGRDWNRLCKVREKLLDADLPISPGDWIAIFISDFQSILISAAKGRVSAYAKRISLGTAASPIPTIDRMIVIYGTLSLIKELCRVFHLRPANGQSITILAQSILHTYLGGVIQDGTAAAAESMGDAYTQHAADEVANQAIESSSQVAAETATQQTVETGTEAASDIARTGLGLTFGKLAGAKATEAALNALLVNRLGSRTIKMLQPVKTVA
jgi:uncharacterized membrane protein YcjF (UPF0283 family)